MWNYGSQSSREKNLLEEICFHIFNIRLKQFNVVVKKRPILVVKVFLFLKS